MSLTSLSLHQNMSQDISKSSGHNLRQLASIVKVVGLICRHPIYIAYLIFFSPYILKLISSLCPLLILLLATTLCAFSTTTSINNNSLLLGDKTQENASASLLEAEAYKIIFDTFQDSVTSLADESDDDEDQKLIMIEERSVPEIVKSCCSFIPLTLKDPPLHEIVDKTSTCDEDEHLYATGKPDDAKFINCDESDEVEAYKLIQIEDTLAPEIVKSCCSSTPLQDPPLHQHAAKTTVFDEYEFPSAVEKPDDTKSTDCSESDENEAEVYKLIKIEETIVPDILKSTCPSTPQQDPPLHQIVLKSTICNEDDLLEKLEDSKSTNCNEAEIIKHPECTTIKDPDQHECEDQNLAKQAKKIKAKLMTTPKSGSNAAIADLHKTSLKSCDSMRREKEWTRTLACKLFEERHNSGGGRQGNDKMDMLWETYESIEGKEDHESTDKLEPHRRRRLTTSLRRSSRSATMESEGAIRVLEEEEGDEVGSGKMCCLQALKITSGKVNMGIGRKNMTKILRGFGWLHKTTNSDFNSKARKY